MELLLNLVWMMLLLPAFWLWQRGQRDRAAHRVTAMQCLLALGCAVVLLFPVISATDDLRAMRSEMEESAGSNREVRQACAVRAASAVHRLQGPPAMMSASVSLPFLAAARFATSFSSHSILSRPHPLHAGRAPPFPSISA